MASRPTAGTPSSPIKKERSGSAAPPACFAVPACHEHFEPAEAPIPENSDFAALSIGRNGELFVPTDFGVTMRAGGKWRYRRKSAGPSRRSHQQRSGGSGRFHLGRTVGIWRRALAGYQQWESWTAADGLTNDTIWAIRRDANRDLWIGTDLGLNRLRIGAEGKPNWRTWTERQGMNGNKVRCVLEGKDGTIWTGSSPGGVSRSIQRPAPSLSFGARDGITNDRVTKLKLDDAEADFGWARAAAYFMASSRGRRMHFTARRASFKHSR